MVTAPSTDQSVIGKLDPASVAAGTTVSTGWLDMAAFRRIQFLLSVGAISANGTVDAVVQQATSSTGTGAKTLTYNGANKAIAQLTQAAGNSNTVSVVNTRAFELDTNNAFRFVRLSVTVGTAAAVLAVTALGDPELTPPTVSGLVIANQIVF